MIDWGSVTAPETTPQTVRTDRPEICAHRGFSSRQPESTAAAYRAAIDFAAEHRIALGVECDVQFTADRQLVCLHDRDLDRVSNGTGPAAERTLDELRRLDFGSWFVPDPTPEQRTVLTLGELLDLIGEARAGGIEITLNLEIKEPEAESAALEEAVVQQLSERGWDGPESPIYVITFFPLTLQRIGELAPDIRRTYLVGKDLAPVIDGTLPDGVTVVSTDVKLLREDPDFVARAQARGNAVHVWTVNDVDDIAFCRDLGVQAITTDAPDRVHQVLSAG